MRDLLVLAGGFALAVGVRVWLWRQVPDFVYEDALIGYRFAENVSAGLGFVYNPGEPVQGSTTPLYVLLLAVFRMVGLSPFLVGPVLNLLADAGSVVLVGLVLRRWGRWSAVLGMAISAMSPIASMWAVSGLETGLYSFLCLLILYFVIIDRPWGWTLASVGVLLIRYDGIIAVGVAILAHTLRSRRMPLPQIGVISGVLVAWSAFSTWYFGSPIPQSIVAKAALYAAHSQGLNPTAARLLGIFVPQTILSVTALRAALLALGIAACRTFARPLWPLPVWAGLYYAVFLLSRTHLHPWYLVPPMHVVSILSVLGFLLVATSLLTRRPRGRAFLQQVAAAAVLTAVLLVSGRWLLQTREIMTTAQRYENSVRRPAGEWLQAHTPPGASVYLEPLGYVGYYSRRYVLDASGRITPSFVRLNLVEQFGHCLKIEGSHPDLVVLRTFEARSDLCGDQDSFWQREYVRVKTFLPPADLDPAAWSGLVVYRRTGSPPGH